MKGVKGVKAVLAWIGGILLTLFLLANIAAGWMGGCEGIGTSFLC